MERSLYWNRRVVYGGLALLGSLLLIDAVPQYTLLHSRLKEWVDPILDVTGLWQGSWDLFAPTPDQVNVRVGARLIWKGLPESSWQQPDWHDMSPWEKTRNFRRMSWFDGLWRRSNSAALVPFCRHLAAEQTKGTTRQLKSIELFQDRDVIPPPTQTWRAAYSAPQYQSRSHLINWSPNE